MVLLNYENFIQERLKQQAEKTNDQRIQNICFDGDFHSLMVKMYEYCQQINIIEQRMDVLAKQTQKMYAIIQRRKNIKPKLLDSEIIKIEEKTKQISSAYSVFLFKQPKIKVASEESIFFENIIKVIISVLQKCFTKEEFNRLKKQINRLIRTNTFNKKICWDEFMEKVNKNNDFSEKKKKNFETNFRGFRRTIFNENSEIRPYVNNRSCFKSSLTRSPIVSLLFPTSQYRSFKLSQRNMRTFKKK